MVPDLVSREPVAAAIRGVLRGGRPRQPGGLHRPLTSAPARATFLLCGARPRLLGGIMTDVNDLYCYGLLLQSVQLIG